MKGPLNNRPLNNEPLNNEWLLGYITHATWVLSFGSLLEHSMLVSTSSLPNCAYPSVSSLILQVPQMFNIQRSTSCRICAFQWLFESVGNLVNRHLNKFPCPCAHYFYSVCTESNIFIFWPNFNQFCEFTHYSTTASRKYLNAVVLWVSPVSLWLFCRGGCPCGEQSSQHHRATQQPISFADEPTLYNKVICDLLPDNCG